MAVYEIIYATKKRFIPCAHGQQQGRSHLAWFLYGQSKRVIAFEENRIAEAEREALVL